eukprot:CAMPEP_0172498272 /NCGR_PEP_ID=MMETSP1066-20121228/111466_1 /TAXON_ID=671091 /ORGANISM="Coscinodiscus wailesii, Strain CCMP2513" /LENGTH=323 /DNA_ID=CAMNT_0013271489 /DNA_START=178 /DNA_END=1149 /DNA_ORIENTATION=-
MVSITITIFGIPDPVHSSIFSPLGVTIIGTIFPLYESIRAICSPEESDDKAWLQYWLAQSAIFYSTEWVGDINERDEEWQLRWHEFEFAFFLWLQCPLTDGASLVYDFVMEPFVSPLVKPAAKRMGEGLQNLVMMMINLTHLWVLWFVFVLLPAPLKRFATVSVGVVYPFCASVVAATTPTGMDDTFWLTYWSCYGVLFFSMDILEIYLARVPGFYTFVLLSSVYLMLPMFNGAEKMFRKVLVPLAGLKEMLLLKDVLAIKKEIFEKLPPGRSELMKKAIAKSFTMENQGGDVEDPLVQYYFNRETETDTNTDGGYQSIPNVV